MRGQAVVPMAYLIFLTILLVPLVEVALFIVVGGIIGLWPTLALAVITAFLGTHLIRRQGLSIIARAQSELASNRLPVVELFDGLCLFVAGALLITPGFATDTLGGLLLVPPLRHWLRSTLARHVPLSHGPTNASNTRYPGDSVIDGDYEDLTDEDPNSSHRGIENR